MFCPLDQQFCTLLNVNIASHDNTRQLIATTHLQFPSRRHYRTRLGRRYGIPGGRLPQPNSKLKDDPLYKARVADISEAIFNTEDTKSSGFDIKDHLLRLKNDTPPEYIDCKKLWHGDAHPDNIGADFRTLMRHVPQPVAVITATNPSRPEDPFSAVTVSTFNSVTMNPPTVSFALKTPSTTLTAILRSGKFMVHFFEPSASARLFTDTLARGNRDARPFAPETTPFLLSSAKRFGQQPNVEAGEPPLLRGVRNPFSTTATEGSGIFRSRRSDIFGPALSFALYCETIPDRNVISDHVVLFGEVKDVYTRKHTLERKNPKLHRMDLAMTYADGRYWDQGINIPSYTELNTPQLRQRERYRSHLRNHELGRNAAEAARSKAFRERSLRRHPIFENGVKLTPRQIRRRVAKASKQEKQEDQTVDTGQA